MTISGNLPAITPSSRSFTDGFYYIAQRQVRLGGTVRVVYGQLLQETSFQLQFQNIDDAIAAEFLEAYDAAMGGLYPVTVPPELLAGTSPQFQALIANTPGQWFITNPVQVESVIPGVSTVSVDLVRDFNNALPVVIRPSAADELFGLERPSAYRVRTFQNAGQTEYQSRYSSFVRFFSNLDVFQEFDTRYSTVTLFYEDEFLGISDEYPVTHSTSVVEYETGSIL